MKKTRMAILFLLLFALISLQGCSPGGTWFPKGSARVHKPSYGNHGPTRGSPFRSGPWGGRDTESVSKEQRK